MATTKDAITEADLLKGVETCSNITIINTNYQLFCETKNDPRGACLELPANVVSNGLSCQNITTNQFLSYLYTDYSAYCAINCYYVFADTVTVATSEIPPSTTMRILSATDTPATPTPTPATPTTNTIQATPTSASHILHSNMLLSWMTLFIVIYMFMRK
ncbi:hypothetical protein BDB01DRAFT_784138 [Pilobolus umbonatus]|nr:hypothetical protein BDB01DRAFT_784138 [Pilobolus umbonatus]